MPSGIKTYLASLALIAIGIAAFLYPDTSTWTAPSGITKNIIAAVAIMLAGGFAAQRHATATSTKRIIDEILVSRGVKAIENETANRG